MDTTLGEPLVTVAPGGEHELRSSGSEEPLRSWFTREVLGHDLRLRRFIARHWRNRDELADLRQEVYARVYEAAQSARPRAPMPFLLATARHLMCDQARREQVVPMSSMSQADLSERLIDEISPEQTVTAQAEVSRLGRAIAGLSPRCRAVLWLRRVEELPQREVARLLCISEKAVEKHLRIGTQKLGRLRDTP